MASPVTAYSYIRFSTPEQHKGDSLRRQSDLAAAYCERKGWTLDASLNLQDFGVSAWKGQNAQQGELAGFLKAIDQGKVLPGSALIVESVDRISRQGIDEGYDLCKRILKAGVHIITLSPERDFGPETVKGLTKGALELLIILERAEEESRTKSTRLTAVWQEKRKAAREGKPQPGRLSSKVAGKSLLTHSLPLWVEEKDGKLVLIPERAEVVKRIFKLTADGYGLYSIVKKFTEERVPPFGGCGHWAKSSLGHILKDRRAVGEYQYSSRSKKSAEPPIPNYYPAVVTEEEWFAARSGTAQRKGKPGRISHNRVNMFTGLLFDAIDGSTYTASTKNTRKHKPVLVNLSAIEGRTKWRSFPMASFEDAILTNFLEIDTSELEDKENTNTAAQEYKALDGEFSELTKDIEEAVRDMDENGVSPAITKVVRKKEARLEEVVKLRDDAQARMNQSPSKSLTEAKSIIRILKEAPDQEDIRLRLRALLRRIVDSMTMVVHSRGMDRLATVQIWFKHLPGKFRLCRILHRPPRGFKLQNANGGQVQKKKGFWVVESRKWGSNINFIDLRKNKSDIEREIKVLQAWKETEESLKKLPANVYFYGEILPND